MDAYEKIQEKEMASADDDHDYEDGLRDGKIISLEKGLKQVQTDLAKFKIAIYMLYGAIALVQFLPELRTFLNGAN